MRWTANTDEVVTFRAPQTVLATGRRAARSTCYAANPDTATGDGIAAAWRAGCRVANMEFIQFPPHRPVPPARKHFLITEAVRGEGAVDCPIGRWHALHARPRPTRRTGPARYRGPRHRLRDEKARPRLRHLDITHQGQEFPGALPNIHARCLSLGIDIAKSPSPVVPAAHYTCGGVVTDLQAAATCPGLYAVGEVTYTGLHGANRLASNSLLECVVLRRALPPWTITAHTCCRTAPPCPPGTTAA